VSVAKGWLGLPAWAIAFPTVGVPVVLLSVYAMGTIGTIVAALVLIGSVVAAVHHAEVVAHRVGEPFGTLVLAIAVTVIEVSLIVSLMLSGSGDVAALARDTVFAAIMIILNFIIGLCLLTGGMKHGEQRFTLRGISAALATLAALVVLSLILPNYTTSAAGPTYASSQLIFVAIVSLVLYGTFVLVQTVRHRDYFLPAGDIEPEEHAPPPTIGRRGPRSACCWSRLSSSCCSPRDCRRRWRRRSLPPGCRWRSSAS